MILSKVVTIGKDIEVQDLARQISRQVFAADNLSEATDILNRLDPDLIIFDQRFEPEQISEFKTTTDKNQSIPIVVIGNNDTNSEEFLHTGADYYLRGPKEHHRLKQIANRINNGNEISDSEDTANFFAADFAASVSIVGRSPAMHHTLNLVKLVANSNCNPILVVGETGTGKELVARAIHMLRHPDQPFVAVNCAALTANLLESELFGHVKGSFTSAEREKTGLLEMAEKGTIFLDEITEMPLELQAKLLRLLQEKTFRKVGGTKEIQCKATIVASSNRNLESEVESKKFRRDLYYRLSTFPVTIAPLRTQQRKADIGLLANYFIKTSSICPRKQPKINAITNLALEALQGHDWPGNVRELQNVIERAILLETTSKIGLSSIILNPTEYSEYAISSASDKIKDFSLVKAEKELIARALDQTGWQKTRAASLLGITRATLYAKVKQHNISKETLDSESLPIEEASLAAPVSVA